MSLCQRVRDVASGLYVTASTAPSGAVLTARGVLKAAYEGLQSVLGAPVVIRKGDPLLEMDEEGY